jgi:hypothetical protein
MLLRLRNWVVVIGLVLATGGHWAALQSVAWVGMTIKYSRNETFASALRKTFDGNNPCDLCKVVREGREAEQKQVAFNLQTKLDLFLVALNSSVEAPVFADEPTPQLFAGRARPESPPTPPPKPV